MTKLQREAIQFLKNNPNGIEGVEALWINHRTWGALVERGAVIRSKNKDGWHIYKLNPEYLANASDKVSKKSLEEWCKKHGYPMPEYEVYGREVHAYFYKAPDGMNRQQWERKLRDVGCKISSEWCSVSQGSRYKDFTGTCVENISYFKGWHWDE